MNILWLLLPFALGYLACIIISCGGRSDLERKIIELEAKLNKRG